MNRFDGYRDSFPNARLTRSESGWKWRFTPMAVR
jgi:hypothetical protein